MNQLYEVSFQVHYEDVIDIGKMLVCASDKDAAARTVQFFLGAPVSQTVVDVKRLKPSVYQLDRREVHKHKEARKRQDQVHTMRDVVDRLSESPHKAPSLASSPWVCTVTAGVRAVSETSEWVKLGHAIIDRAHHNGSAIGGGITEFEMTCEQAALRPKPSGFERQAIYKEPQFFAGGAARPR